MIIGKDANQVPTNGMLGTAAFVDIPHIHDSYTREKITGAIGNINSPLLDMPLKNSLAMKAGVGTVTFTRASTATYIDRYDVLKVANVDEPRFEKEGYLNEGASTNLLTYSEQFDNAIWTKSNSTITANTAETLDPYGTNLSDKLIASATTSVHNTQQGSISFVSGTTYTSSVFVKLGEVSAVDISMSGGFSVLPAVRFDLTAKTGTLRSGAPTYSITKLANGWLRVSITAVADTTATGSMFIGLVSGTVLSFLGDGTSGLYLFGAQLEALPFATSYIPTTTASVTRAKDSLSVSAANNIGYGSHAKTIIMDTSVLGHINDYQYAFDLTNYISNRVAVSSLNSVSNKPIFYFGSGNDIYMENTKLTENVTYRLAASISGGVISTILTYANGASRGNGVRTVSIDGAPLDIYIGQTYTGGKNLYGHISNLRIYDRVLTSTEVALA